MNKTKTNNKKMLVPRLRFGGFEGEWEEKRLGEILKYEQPNKYIVESTEYNNSYKTPVLTAGKTFMLGLTNEVDNIFNNLPVIIFDDFTTATKYVDFPFKVKSSAMKILKIAEDNNLKLIFEGMQAINYDIGGHGRQWISIFSNFEIKLPKSKEEQAKIASFLTLLDQKITAHENKIINLEKYKKSLMQGLFGREICFVGEGFGVWEERRLGKLLKYEQPNKYIVESTEYDNSYKTPVLTAGKTFILGYTNETNNLFESLPVIIFDDFTTATKYVDFPFKVKSSAMKILKTKDDQNLKIIFEAMQAINYDIGAHGRQWISIFSNFEIKLPKSKNEQTKIAHFIALIDKKIEKERVLVEGVRGFKKGVLEGVMV